MTLPRVRPAGHNWPIIKFDLASQMFLVKDNNESEKYHINSCLCSFVCFAR